MHVLARRETAANVRARDKLNAEIGVIHVFFMH